jgi:hypothetical protein
VLSRHPKVLTSMLISGQQSFPDAVDKERWDRHLPLTIASSGIEWTSI